MLSAPVSVTLAVLAKVPCLTWRGISIALVVMWQVLPFPMSPFPLLPLPMSPVPVLPRPILPLSPGPPSWALLPLENVVSPGVVDGVAWFEANCGFVLVFFCIFSCVSVTARICVAASVVPVLVLLLGFVLAASRSCVSVTARICVTMSTNTG